MKKDKLKIKGNNKIYITYTILFGVISFVVFAVFIKNNRGFIWNSDGFTQHFVFLYDFNQMIRNMFENGFSMLSWNMGLGLDVIGQYSYYVIGDPFAYISLLFPMEHLETVYSFLVILRIYCVGLAFIAYCKYKGKEKINTLLGAIIYTFCGFILYAGIRHPYFTNAAILLPLNFIGVEKFLRENKKAFFTFIIFVSAISNYYFFYMLTIVTIIYAFVKYIFEYNQGLKVFFRKVLSAILCYIIGVSMAGVVLLPTVYAFLNSARPDQGRLYSYIPGFYKNFFMGIISMRFKNWAVVSVSSIVLLMIPVLFTKLKNKEARSFVGLFIITTAMLLTPFIGSMMNGFSFPSNRWVFAYSFILSYIVTICFDKELEYSKKQIISMIATLGIYCIIGAIITKFKIKSNLDFYGAMAVAIFILGIIVLNNISKSTGLTTIVKKYANMGITILVICNIWGISFALYSNHGKGYAKEFLYNNSAIEQYATLKGKMNNFEEAIKYIKENDTGFYRIAKCDKSNPNVSLVYDYNSVQSYVSIGNSSVYNLSCGLEDNCYTVTKCVDGMDRRTKILTLLGVKYYICSNKDISYVPYGYTLYKEIGDAKIYINENNISIGTVYDRYILKDEYEELSPLQKEEALLSIAVLEQDTTDVRKEDDIINRINENKELRYTVENDAIKNNQIIIEKNNQKVNLEIDEIEENTEIYLSITNLKYNSGSSKTSFKVTASFNGIKDSEKVEDCISSAYYVENPNFLMNLGVIRENFNKNLQLIFDSKGTYSFDRLEILAVPMEDYEEKARMLKQNEMTNVEYGNDFISGNVNMDTNGILQITTSYSEGWKVFIDGKEAEIIKVNEGFIGTFVEEGEHRIEFKYRTPYLNLGIFFSVVGFIGFVLVVFYEKKKVQET